MAGKRLNPRLAKIHRNYTIEEVARLFGVHRQTVRNWIKGGLPALIERKPHLILGSSLREFLIERRRAHKRRCAPGELYCLRCREPRRPAGDMLEYLPRTIVSGNLRGICPVCDALIHRNVSLAKVTEVAGGCEVTFPQDQTRLVDTGKPSQNCHFEKE
jgi:hypothetical protein